ncbi:hypothetical protein [Nocardiopsis eucommiae]|uniref:hypothetical protein n=1 Tax=Nocardiopsis eucommiae TaxID=2831970 RepID=UPI003D74368E
MNLTTWDRYHTYYMPPELFDAEDTCVYEVGDSNCGEPSQGLFCDRHEEVVSAEESSAYQWHYAAE